MKWNTCDSTHIKNTKYMKKVSIIILLIFIFSCSKARKEADMMKNEVLIETTNEDSYEEFEFQNISKQKLQDLYDLLVLQNKHPEFTTDIIKQLKEISKDSISISNKIENITINNIAVIESIQKISDSIQIQKIDFDITSNLGTSKDTLLVMIKTKKVRIDDEQFESTQVTFKKVQ